MKLNPQIKQGIQITISLGIAIWIFWFLYRDIEFESLTQQIRSSKWAWILGSMAISLIGFWIRGWRWTLLISKEEGKQISSWRAYHAVMVGYLVNLLLPRAGEVARCGVLNRSNQVPLGHLIGTVLIERSVDLLFMIGVIFLSFLVENQLFRDLLGEFVNLESLKEAIIENLPLAIGGLAIFFIFIYLIGKRFQDNSLIQRIQHFLREIGGGLKQIKSISNPTGFWISSLVIWIIYFFTLYTVTMAIESTANLSMGEALLVMVMGTIGMLAPVQGGIGTFHALVALILIQFGISETDGKIFAAIIHGSQMILMVLAGLISWFWMLKLSNQTQPDKA